MLLTCLLEAHAWATARPRIEAALERERLETDLFHIIETEKLQGMSSESPQSLPIPPPSSLSCYGVVGMLRSTLTAVPGYFTRVCAYLGLYANVLVACCFFQKKLVNVSENLCRG